MDETHEQEKIHRISPSPPPERERLPDSEHCSAKSMDSSTDDDGGGSRSGPVARVNGAGAAGERAAPAPGVGTPSTVIPTTTTGVKIKQEPKEGDMKVRVLYLLYNLLESMIR